MESKSEATSECCPKFDPTQWDDKVFEWSNKKFIKDHVFTLFYMPVNFGRVMIRLNKIIEKANVTVVDWLCLSDHTSRWNMDIYLAADKDVAGAENVVLSGKFYCKVYEGPFKDMGKWTKDFDNVLKNKGFGKNKLFFWYTTCPKCAKKYGKNYVALIARIS